MVTANAGLRADVERDERADRIGGSLRTSRRGRQRRDDCLAPLANAVSVGCGSGGNLERRHSGSRPESPSAPAVSDSSSPKVNACSHSWQAAMS